MVRDAMDDTALTHSQRQIWIGQRLHPESSLYNMAFAFVFPIELRTDLFREAWCRVAGGSDALRTRVIEVEGGGAGRVMEAEAGPTAVLDFGRRVDPDREFYQWCRERCARPLPFGGELFDSVLVRLGEGRTGWYLNQHHVVTDAWAMAILYRRMEQLYLAATTGTPAP